MRKRQAIQAVLRSVSALGQCGTHFKQNATHTHLAQYPRIDIPRRIGRESDHGCRAQTDRDCRRVRGCGTRSDPDRQCRRRATWRSYHNARLRLPLSTFIGERSEAPKGRRPAGRADYTTVPRRIDPLPDSARGLSMQVDLTGQAHGVKSFNRVRSNAVRLEISGRTILVASLADIIKSKKEANRPQDVAVLHVLQRTLEEQENAQGDPA